mmetsp:Transcript_16731/g.52726  ORF Transcript_16731/g.52726 Transcript_16731/m.52726 type:complete len:1012 (+) Transcript_16731:568-3603(+)
MWLLSPPLGPLPPPPAHRDRVHNRIHIHLLFAPKRGMHLLPAGVVLLAPLLRPLPLLALLALLLLRVVLVVRPAGLRAVEVRVEDVVAADLPPPVRHFDPLVLPIVLPVIIEPESAPALQLARVAAAVEGPDVVLELADTLEPLVFLPNPAASTPHAPSGRGRRPRAPPRAAVEAPGVLVALVPHVVAVLEGLVLAALVVEQPLPLDAHVRHDIVHAPLEVGAALLDFVLEVGEGGVGDANLDARGFLCTPHIVEHRQGLGHLGVLPADVELDEGLEHDRVLGRLQGAAGHPHELPVDPLRLLALPRPEGPLAGQGGGEHTEGAREGGAPRVRLEVVVHPQRPFQVPRAGQVLDQQARRLAVGLPVLLPHRLVHGVSLRDPPRHAAALHHPGGGGARGRHAHRLHDRLDSHGPLDLLGEDERADEGVESGALHLLPPRHHALDDLQRYVHVPRGRARLDQQVVAVVAGHDALGYHLLVHDSCAGGVRLATAAVEEAAVGDHRGADSRGLHVGEVLQAAVEVADLGAAVDERAVDVRVGLHPEIGEALHDARRVLHLFVGGARVHGAAHGMLVGPQACADGLVEQVQGEVALLGLGRRVDERVVTDDVGGAARGLHRFEELYRLPDPLGLGVAHEHDVEGLRVGLHPRGLHPAPHHLRALPLPLLLQHRQHRAVRHRVGADARLLHLVQQTDGAHVLLGAGAHRDEAREGHQVGLLHRPELVKDLEPCLPAFLRLGARLEERTDDEVVGRDTPRLHLLVQPERPRELPAVVGRGRHEDTVGLLLGLHPARLHLLQVRPHRAHVQRPGRPAHQGVERENVGRHPGLLHLAAHPRRQAVAPTAPAGIQEGVEEVDAHVPLRHRLLVRPLRNLEVPRLARRCHVGGVSVDVERQARVLPVLVGELCVLEVLGPATRAQHRRVQAALLVALRHDETELVSEVHAPLRHAEFEKVLVPVRDLHHPPIRQHIEALLVPSLPWLSDLLYRSAGYIHFLTSPQWSSSPLRALPPALRDAG